MATITVYGGAGEIGGNQILLEWAEPAARRVLLDFGTGFSRLGRFFEEFLRPRGAALGLRDYLRTGLLPPLEGLYREDLQAHETDLWSRYRAHPAYRALDGVDAVLLSHAHLDHNGYLGFLRPEIPVYTGLVTAVLGKAIQDHKQTTLDAELCYVAPRERGENGWLKAVGGVRRQRPFFVVDGDDVALARCAPWWQSLPNRDTALLAEPLARWRAPDIGAELRLRYWPVDHSIPGAGAFAIETDAGWVVYTGDLRLHGARGESTRRFAREAAALGDVVLVVEGTRVTEAGGTPTTEDDVHANAAGAVRFAQGLVIADFGARNLERLQTFHSIARECGRRLVITTADAYVLDALRAVDPSMPAPADAAVAVLREPKSGAGALWERELCERFAGNVITADDIARDPRAYLACFSFWDINNLVDLEPEGGLYLFSSAEAYNEEMVSDFKRLRAWLEHFELRPVGVPGLDGHVDPAERGFHASGHIHGAGLEELIETIAPRRIVPVHTEHPEWFRTRWGERVAEVAYGVPIRLD